MIVKSALGIVSAIALGASPALANDLEPLSQMLPVEEAAAGGLSANADQEFQELYASWEALDDGGRVTAEGNIEAAPRMAVNVPSRAPIDEFRMTSAYGMRNHPILRQRRHHRGVDLAAPRGTPVYATADGMVGQAEWFSSYGNYVRIEHGGELHTRYAHLSSYTVSAGEWVEKGDLIGYVGSTGRSTGPHLHYEVRVGEDDSVDPIPYMLARFDELEESEGAMGGPE